MKKNISVIIMLAFMILSSSCSTYNSLVPSFATIGSSSVPDKTKTDAELTILKVAYEKASVIAKDANIALRKAKEAYLLDSNNSTWWNPNSWF